MATPIDIPTLINDMKNAATSILKKDVTTLDGFSERQIKDIAQQAAQISLGIASGEITAETKDFFLDNLKEMTRNLAATLAGMVAVTVESLWNALVGVLWKAISAATGVGLNIP